MLKANLNGSACTIAIASVLLVNMAEGSKEPNPIEATSEKLSALPEERLATPLSSLFGDGLTKEQEDTLKQIMKRISEAKIVPKDINSCDLTTCSKIPDKTKTDLEDQIEKLKVSETQILVLFKSKLLHFLEEQIPSLSDQEKQASISGYIDKLKRWVDSIKFDRRLLRERGYFDLCNPYESSRLGQEASIGEFKQGDADGISWVECDPLIKERAELRSRLIVYILRLAGISRKYVKLMSTNVRAEVFEWFIPERKVTFSLQEWHRDLYWPEVETGYHARTECLAKNLKGQVPLIIELLKHGAKISHFIYNPDRYAPTVSMTTRECEEIEKEIASYLKENSPDTIFEAKYDKTSY